MKKQILILGVALITIGLMMITSAITHAQEANEFTIPLSDPAKRGKLKATLHYGSISIKGTARKDVLVKYKGEEDDDRHKDRGDKTKDGLKRISGAGLDLEASETDNTIKIRSGSGNSHLNLEIEVPSAFDIDLTTHNDGDLNVTGIQGSLELTNHNGAITALNISGSVVATTYNDGIKVTFDKVTEATPMSFTTYNGDIDITLPAAVKATFKMKTEQGEIYTGFDMAITSKGPVQKRDNQSGVYKVTIDDWKKGDINGGGPEITLKNYNGDIFIRKK